MDVIDKTVELGKLIQDSKEFKRFNQKEILFLNDNDLQKKYNEYKDIYKEYANTNNNDLKVKIDFKYNELLKNNNFKNYLEAKEVFEQLIFKVSSIIEYYTGHNLKSCFKGSCNNCNKKRG